MSTLVRGARILAFLTRGSKRGLTLSQIADGIGLARPTVYRIILELEAEGLVSKSAEKQYKLGPTALQLGRAAASQNLDLVAMARPAVESIADATGDTVFVNLRIGREAVCADRCFGSYHIKTLTMDVGDRRPLGIGAGSLAILARLPEYHLRTLFPEIATGSGAESPLMLAVKTTRVCGYAYSDGTVMRGVRGVGVALVDRQGVPQAALSVSAISSRLSLSRVKQIAEILHFHKVSIERKLADLSF
jgi:DNA-binding IclR family transcriptional regulator